jgi:TldD protein
LKRKDFLQLSAMGAGAMMLPDFALFGKSVDPSAFMNDGMDVSLKKQLADVALNAARAKGATYADVRIGRYLNQFVATRENRVQNVANAESFGVGIRVLADGCWGFAASNRVTKDDVAKTAERAVAVAKANARSVPTRYNSPRKKALAM